MEDTADADFLCGSCDRVIHLAHAHELQHLTDAVSEAYRQAGWLVRAYIPRQDLSGPELTVQVIETIK